MEDLGLDMSLLRFILKIVGRLGDGLIWRRIVTDRYFPIYASVTIRKVRRSLEFGVRLVNHIEQGWPIYGIQKDFVGTRHSVLSQLFYFFRPTSVSI